MTVEVSRQGLEFLWAALLGIGLGFVYDLGRALRREKPGLTVPVDAVFALIFFLSLWMTSIYTRGLKLYQCMGVFLGAGLYFLTVSPPLLRLWRSGLRHLARLRQKFRRVRKKSAVFLQKLVKKLFPSLGKWGTIINIPHIRKCHGGKELQR